MERLILFMIQIGEGMISVIKVTLTNDILKQITTYVRIYIRLLWIWI